MDKKEYMKNTLAFRINGIWLCALSSLILNIKVQFLYRYNQKLILLVIQEWI